jgi:acetylornithine deacetylase/succinyl-diaminopimelate desuccinylase-like protein
MAANATAGIDVGELTADAAVRERLQWFTREKQWINEVHLELCRQPAPTFLEQERAAWFLTQFKSLGWQAFIDRAGNVIATWGSEPYIALTAHLDTVIAPKNRESISVAPDGSFLGPGVSDNGAGLAALLAIARAWPAGQPFRDLHRGLLLAANVGEEGEGNLLGMRHLCKQSALGKKIEAYIVADGGDVTHITTQALGSRRFELAFTGPGGHSWSDFGVANPLHALCRAVSLFSETRLPGSPRSAFNVGVIEGGSSVNAIPQSARAKVDLRSEHNQRLDELVDALESATDRARDAENQRAAAGKVTAQLKEIGSRPAAALPDSAAILQYIRSVDAHLGIRSRLDCSSTDANIPLSLGIPAIAIGAGGLGGGAHTTAEWYRPEGRDLGLKRILLTLLLLMRAGNGK